LPADDETMLFMRLEQERTNDGADDWLRSYGFPHDCHCADDVQNDNVSEAPECYLEASRSAFEGLRAARGTLFAIATSTTTDAAALKQLAFEAVNGGGH
jgi:hypothetical protein